MKFALFHLLSATSFILLSSCASVHKAEVVPEHPLVQAHRLFESQANYKSTVYKNDELLAQLTPEEAKIEISLSKRRAYLKKGEFVAVDTPVSPGTASHPTPAGDFTIIEKNRMHRSNLYGKVVDAEGNVVEGSADSRKAEIPEGGKFVGTAMPYWMRLTNTGIGLHVGYVPDRPASHGCVRLPESIGPVIFEKVKYGTPVEIVK